MLPKGIYELLPYLYLLGGAGIILHHGGIALLLGSALFIHGAWVWNLRSARRRRSDKLRRGHSSRRYLGDALYELLPFIYMLCGLYLLALLPHEVRWVSGPLMIVTGALLLVIRASQRRKPSRALPEANCDPVDRLALASAQRPGGAGLVSPEPRLIEVPQEQRCSRCAIDDLCAGVALKRESVGEIMRLAQTLDPQQALEPFRAAVQRLEGRAMAGEELRPLVEQLHSHASLCATWRHSGRHG